MQRTFRLGQGEVLWQAGDPAGTIAVVVQGKLGARSQKRVVGIMSRRMVLGESALFSLDGEPEVRTHSVYAIEPDTEVTEYPAVLVKQMLDDGIGAVTPLILRTLVGQICRNWLIVASANRERPYLTTPLKNFAEGLIDSLGALESIANWADFMVAFRFLYNVRDLSEAERDRMVAPSREPFIEIVRASHTLRWLFKDQHAAEYLDAFIAAEEERRALLEGA
jgi:hypothetical protein